MRKITALCAAAILANVVAAGPADAATRGTFVMNTTKSDVMLVFHGAGSQATYADIEAGGRRIVNWDDHGAKTPRIEVVGCGKRQTLSYTLTTTHSVLHLSGECLASLQPGRS